MVDLTASAYIVVYGLKGRSIRDFGGLTNFLVDILLSYGILVA